MACTGCRKRVQAKLPSGVRVVRLKSEPTVDPWEGVEEFDVTFLGASTGLVTYRGPSGTRYRFAWGPMATQRLPRVDAEFFDRLDAFEVTPAAAG